MKKVTMQQIADQVGVSKFAVSQALSGKPGVSDETRERIVQTAAMLGYYSQRHARLKQGTGVSQERETSGTVNKMTVIVLIPNVRFQNRDSLYWGRIIDGVTIALEEQGLGVMMVTEYNTDYFLNVINPNAVLGMIGIGLIANRVLLDVRNAGIPFVLIDHEEALVPCDTIFMNNYDCMRRVTTHLIGLGHRNIRFVGSPFYSRSFYDRYMGYRAVLEEYKIPLPREIEAMQAIELESDIEVGIRSLMEHQQLPTAFVCANDSHAIQVIAVLSSLGVNVPGEISVTGFDNTEESAQCEPAVSTVNVPKEELGRRAVETLLRRLSNPDVPIEKVLLYGDLIVRESVQATEAADS
ncbi:LacI family transcriptional regulator [Paenibacillus phyllosphaerae]|uniref:LacI family transcriptional regulator n=1 Tax=Paenibacillus phyllosphaerae TaxID=274593 RepID=A0A7W5FMG7_9BACL|nr:LacI family DNA-binding transcriptional regulator [Paenibacillus phyllosphaerae]MBB3109979.1 LacI family transcriptional regulator [Paenibacillus phyllosphaerae]